MPSRSKREDELHGMGEERLSHLHALKLGRFGAFEIREVRIHQILNVEFDSGKMTVSSFCPHCELDVRNQQWEAEQKRDPIPAIALTAFASNTDRQKVTEAGFLEHLAKPVEAAILISTILKLAGTGK